MRNLDVLEILRVGLSGLIFLLAVLAFRLIHQEQQRTASPRKGILKSIYVFMAVNLLSAMLAGGISYLMQQPGAEAEALAAKTYLVENTIWLVDLTKWTPELGGPVVVRRSDLVTKVSDTREDFVLPSYTTGNAIDWTNLGAGVVPTFKELHAPDLAGNHAYQYILPMGGKPKADTEQFASEFTFHGGFKGPNSRWWKGYVAYPTKSVTVSIRFPSDRPCLGIPKVYMQEGSKEPLAVTNNSPLMSEGGQVVTWTGAEIAKETRIEFEWDWNDQQTAKN
jgi:hypothetical protein